MYAAIAAREFIDNFAADRETMKSPNAQWEELADGSLRLVYYDLHPEADVLIIPVDVRKPLSSSRVKLCLRNKETGEVAQWADSESGSPRELALSTAMNHGIRYRKSPAWLLKIGIDFYEDDAPWMREWEREEFRFGRHHR